MRIYALHDANGTILAAVDLDAEAAQPQKTVLRPIVPQGEFGGEFDVPPSHAQLGLLQICEALRVDGATKSLTPLPRPGLRAK